MALPQWQNQELLNQTLPPHDKFMPVALHRGVHGDCCHTMQSGSVSHSIMPRHCPYDFPNGQLGWMYRIMTGGP